MVVTSMSPVSWSQPCGAAGRRGARRRLNLWYRGLPKSPSGFDRLSPTAARITVRANTGAVDVTNVSDRHSPLDPCSHPIVEPRHPFGAGPR
jgi:hypothetical protein